MCRLAAFIGDLGSATEHLKSFRRLAAENGDGFGIGGYVAGEPRIVKTTTSALEDPSFSLERFTTSNNAVVHLRKATVGSTDVRNSHPFDMGGRLVAHNGTIGEVGRLEELIGPTELRRLGVTGETDSERLAAYLAMCTERAGGDIVQGYRQLVTDLADRNPMTSITSVTATPNGDVFALRYPENRSLFWKRLGARDAADGHRLLGPTDGGVTVLASRPLDAAAGWNELMPGQVLHVRGGDLTERIHTVAREEPRFRLTDEHVDDGASWLGPRRSQLIKANLSA